MRFSSGDSVRIVVKGDPDAGTVGTVQAYEMYGYYWVRLPRTTRLIHEDALAPAG